MPSEPQPFCDKVRIRPYPTHESGGHRLGLLGPQETMTPFRDFGTEGHDPAEFMATKQVTTCNWVQAMEGNLDTAHISHLHQFDGIDDIPDDGSDKPGYPSNAMSWKFWRRDRAPRLELEETWYGYRYAGVRTTPNGNTHVRITAYALPYSTMVASIPFSVGQECSCRSTTRTAGAISSCRRSGRIPASSAARTCSPSPRSRRRSRPPPTASSRAATPPRTTT